MYLTATIAPPPPAELKRARDALTGYAVFAVLALAAVWMARGMGRGR